MRPITVHLYPILGNNTGVLSHGVKRPECHAEALTSRVEIKDGPGRDSLVCIGTRYGLDGLGIESWWRRDIPRPSGPTLGPTQPPIQRVRGLSRA